MKGYADDPLWDGKGYGATVKSTALHGSVQHYHITDDDMEMCIRHDEGTAKIIVALVNFGHVITSKPFMALLKSSLVYPSPSLK